MYKLIDTFNDKILSQHRKLKNAIIAQLRFAAAVRRANGSNSYIPTEIQGADANEILNAENEIYNN